MVPFLFVYEIGKTTPFFFGDYTWRRFIAVNLESFGYVYENSHPEMSIQKSGQVSELVTAVTYLLLLRFSRTSLLS